MAEAEGIAARTPAAAWYRERVEEVEADVLAALNKHWPMVGSQVIAHGLIETCGSVLAAIIDAEPMAAMDIDTKIGDMRLFVATTSQRTQ